MSAARYEPAGFESGRQIVWDERGLHATPGHSATARDTYVYIAPPFTSGNIHMGHVRSYTIADAYVRYRRALGESVLFCMGWDAFGLPAELQAIERGITPREWVDECRARMTEQMKRLGLSFDWQREFDSSEPEFYRWSQWLFLTLLEAGLVYRRAGRVDWCQSCETTLAKVQVEDGECWRCHETVTTIEQPLWYLRISAYAAENDTRLGELPGTDKAWAGSQTAHLGRTDGIETDATGPTGRTLTVFTPHESAVDQAECVMISPRHPDIESWVASPELREKLAEVERSGSRVRSRSASSALVVRAGCALRVPGIDSPLPLVITSVVDSRFGETAVLGIPTVDHVDEVVCRRAGIKLPDGAVHGENSARGWRRAARYRASDWTISRQRSWGAPIPIVCCDACGLVPVPRDQLPVLLPDDLNRTGSGNPLVEHEDFVRTVCPACGSAARRETDTLDCHFDAVWMWAIFCVPAEDRHTDLFTHPELRRWLPGDRIIWGADGGAYMFDHRVTAKALRDCGPLAWLTAGEPFSAGLMHEMVKIDGRKMSKHLHNGVNPDDLVRQVGADVIRLAVLIAAAPRSPLTWTDAVVRRAEEFLADLWSYWHLYVMPHGSLDEDAAVDTSDSLRRRLSGWCEVGARRVTEDLRNLQLHRAGEDVMRLFVRIRDFEARVVAAKGELEDDDRRALVAALRLLVRLLSPLAPHISDELWDRGGGTRLACELPWPLSGEIAE